MQDTLCFPGKGREGVLFNIGVETGCLFDHQVQILIIILMGRFVDVGCYNLNGTLQGEGKGNGGGAFHHV